MDRTPRMMLSSNRCIPYLKTNASEAVANMPNWSYESGRHGVREQASDFAR